MPNVTYTLTIDEVPASQDILQTIQQIEVEDHADMADMIRLQVVIGVKDGCSGWSVIDEDIFKRLSQIRIAVTIGSRLPETLMNAYVIETSATFANQPGPTFNLTRALTVGHNYIWWVGAVQGQITTWSGGLTLPRLSASLRRRTRALASPRRHFFRS